MLNILLSGCHGRAGRQVADLCHNSLYFRIVAGTDSQQRPDPDFPVYQSPLLCPDADVLIDFSVPDALPQVLDACTTRRMPAVLAVTGYSVLQQRQIQAAARTVPLFCAPNLSLGANVLLKLACAAAADLDHYSVFVVDHHHKYKRDSPSGTALLLAQASHCSPSCIYSIRSGTAPGEHHVTFSGDHETLELIHRTENRAVYAAGALRAAQFIAATKTPGLYGMNDLLM